MADSDVGNDEHSTTDDIIFSKPMYLLKQGRQVYRIKGDGNCMYRAISYSMTNDQENYPSLKLLLERFENLNQNLFSGLLTSVNKPTITKHIAHLGMPNTWGTHIELIATATYFNVLVYTFIADDQQWEVYKPLSAKELRYPVTTDKEDELFAPRSHIELLYHRNLHYDCIVDCTTQQSSTTKPNIQSSTDSLVIEV